MKSEVCSEKLKHAVWSRYGLLCPIAKNELLHCEIWVCNKPMSIHCYLNTDTLLYSRAVLNTWST